MNSLECLSRNLADLLFLIQDYDQAYSVYKSLAADLKV